MQYGAYIVNANHYPSLKRGWCDSMVQQMAGQYGTSGKHVEDAEPGRPGKLVEEAEPVRVVCQYTSSSEQLLNNANLGSPFY
jgi:hypothetical protein